MYPSLEDFELNQSGIVKGKGFAVVLAVAGGRSEDFRTYRLSTKLKKN